MSVLLTVASKTLWPEYEITIEDESEFITSDTDENSDSLISRQQMDETVNSLMDSFEVSLCCLRFLLLAGGSFFKNG